MFSLIHKMEPAGFPVCILTIGFSSLQQYFELRSRQIQKLRETQSPNPYPHKFEPSISLTEYVELYGFNEEVKAEEEKEAAELKKKKVIDEVKKGVESVRARHTIIKPGEKLEGTVQALAGRIHNVRASGQKLRFYDLHGEGTKVQIMATLQYVNRFISVFHLRLTFSS